MSDNDIRTAATDLLSRVEYGRISDLTRAEMTPWDELGEETRENWRVSFRRHVDVLVDAGWRPAPTVISTIDDLAALPDGTIIREPHGCVAVKSEDCWELPNTIGLHLGDALELPVTVLWMPEGNDRG